MNAIKAEVAAMEKELNMRLAAAAHLVDLPKRHNQNAIDSLYDRLCDANIRLFEAA